MDRNEILYPVENAYRHHRNLNGIWYFTFAKHNESYENGVPKKQSMPVPSNFSDIFLRREEREFVGNVWYEKQVYIEKSWLGEDVFLRFDGIAHKFVVYVNGVEICREDNGAIPTAVEITRQLRYGDTNSIVVKVNNELNDRTIPKGVTTILANGKKYNTYVEGGAHFGGIIKSVHLYTIPNTRITDYVITTLKASEEQAEVHYSVQVVGNCLVTATLRNREGKVVATSVGGNATLVIDEPRLWSLEEGYLYRIDFEVSRLGKHCDSYTVYFGIRTICVDKGRLLLNGKPVYLKGVPVDYRGLNGISCQSMIEAKKIIEEMKLAGYNTIFVGAYPLAEEIHMLAELEGILVVESISMSSIVTEKASLFTSDNGNSEGNKSPIFIQTGIMERDKNYDSTIIWKLLLPTFRERDSNSENYSEALALQMQQDDAYKRLYMVEVDLLGKYVPEIILEQAQVLLVKAIPPEEYGYDHLKRDMYDALHQKLVQLQLKYPDKVMIISYITNDLNADISLYHRQEDYEEFSRIIHNISTVRGEIYFRNTLGRYK